MTRILVVEDNADNMKLFRWTLEDEGWEILESTSAEHALERLIDRAERVDAIVMDISLPGIDGKEATRRLRQRPEFAELPILAATAHAIKEEDLAIRAAGVTDIVTKPIDEDLFVATMRKLVDHTAETSHGARLSR